MADRSPSILADSWGRLEVEGTETAFKDAKLYPGGAREWDWGETGTHHQPGVLRGDMDELVEQGARIVVVGVGREGRLGVTGEARRHMREHGVAVEELETAAAIERYNELAASGAPVGALIHSTC